MVMLTKLQIYDPNFTSYEVPGGPVVSQLSCVLHRTVSDTDSRNPAEQADRTWRMDVAPSLSAVT